MFHIKSGAVYRSGLSLPNGSKVILRCRSLDAVAHGRMQCAPKSETKHLLKSSLVGGLSGFLIITAAVLGRCC